VGGENYGTILLTAGILVASALVIHVAMYWLLIYFGNREHEAKKPEFPLAAEENCLPLSERLQQTAQSQPLLEGLRRQEGQAIDMRPRDNQPSAQTRLQTFGPADPPEKRYARIPIDVAMRLMLEKGRLPVQKGEIKDKQEKKGP
jgi:hypothetical protein